MNDGMSAPHLTFVSKQMVISDTYSMFYGFT